MNPNFLSPFPKPSLFAIFRALWLCLLLHPLSASALDNEFQTSPGFQVQKDHGGGYSADYGVSARIHEGVEKVERYTLAAGFGRRIGRARISGAYNLHLRRLNSGNEHRLYQQAQYSFPQAASSLTLRLRLEQRYFDHDHELASRIRGRLAWSKPLNSDSSLILSNETAHNLYDSGTSIRKGFTQNISSFGYRRELRNDRQLALTYNFRYIEQAFRDNRARHQIQIAYLLRL